MKTKLITLLVGLGLPLASAFASEATTAAAGGPIVIGMSLAYLPHPFFRAMADEAEREAARLGVKIEVVDAQWDSSKQIVDLENFVRAGVRGILVAPKAPDSVVPAIEAAVKAGIPVATIDGKVSTDKVLFHVGVDDVEAGRVAARFIIDKLGNKGSVIELEGLPGASPALDRKAGFEEAIKKSSVRLLESKTANYDRSTAFGVTRDLMKDHPSFNAVFAANDEMIIGAIDAMSVAGVDLASKVTVGVGTGPDAFEYMRNRQLSAIVDQFPGEQGSQALQHLVGYLKNETMPPKKVILITPKIVTKVPGGI